MNFHLWVIIPNICLTQNVNEDVSDGIRLLRIYHKLGHY